MSQDKQTKQSIRVLVATKETQGQRPSDFSHAQAGEIVHFSFGCDMDETNIDGSCGCRRSMSGFVSGKATTTFTIAESHLSEIELFAVYRQYYNKTMPGIMTNSDIRESVSEHLEFAANWPVGTVLERRGNVIQPRRVAEQTLVT